MIRINLLPVRAAKKKESLMLHIIAASAALVLAIIIGMGVFVYFSAIVSGLNNKMNEGETELAALKAKTGELENILKEKNKVQGKLDVVERLDKARSGPVEMYKLFSKTVPMYAWIINTVDKGNQVHVDGTAVSELVVSEFMKNLEGTGVFSKVELIETKSGSPQKGTQVVLVNFSMDLYRK